MAKHSGGDKAAFESNPVSVKDSGDQAAPTSKEDLFSDPRSQRDRRQRNDPTKIPGGTCRRSGDRRTMLYIKNDCWWIKRNYNKAQA